MSNNLYSFKKPENDTTTKGGKPDNGYEKIDSVEIIADSKKPPVRMSAILIVIAAICVIAGGILVIRSAIQGTAKASAVDVIELDHDINFSQVDNLETSAVDVLIKLENHTDSPIRSMEYKISYNEGTYHNRMDDTDTFFAFGQIGAGETGYMYSQLYLPSDTPREQGQISICSVEKGKDLGDYTTPSGQVTGFDEVTDSYDVYIMNPNDSDVNLRESVVIAVAEGSDSLADAWGCSTQESIALEYIGAKKDATLKGAIHDPGFGEPYDETLYRAFVIEKEVIGID